MSSAEAEDLKAYALSMELTRPSLCGLIIQMELGKPRLKSRIPRPVSIPKADATRVTVHLRNAALKTAFYTHVENLGRGSDEAASELFLAELKEQRIIKLLGIYWNRS